MLFAKWIPRLLVCLAIFGPALAENSVDPGLAQAVALVQESATRHRLILLGEKHGTREIPVFIAALVDAYAAEGPVVLALEIPCSEQPALEQFLDSEGDASAMASLRSTPFWSVHGDQHDGRRSLDMLELLERLRSLRRSGREVSLLAFDRPSGAAPDAQARDRAMADLLRAQMARQAHARFLVLAGNVHAMLAKPSYAPPEMQTPMGAYLTDLEPYSVNITAHSGKFWVCQARCGPIAEFPTAEPSGPVGDGTYHLQVVLPRFSLARLLGASAQE